MKKSKLGKGLESLVGNVVVKKNEELKEIEISKIRPNPEQPRKSFNSKVLADLAESIKENGLIQPVVVQETLDGYMLIAGERRTRAFQLLHRHMIPAIIRVAIQDEKLLELALIENIQREDLNPMERSKAYKRMIEQLNLTQEQASKRLGKSRAGIANSLRLLSLPLEVQALIETRRISEGHAKVLLQSEDADRVIELAKQITAEGWSVRTLEENISKPKPSLQSNQASVVSADSPHIMDLENRLCGIFGTRVKIVVSKTNKYKGKFVIEFNHNDDFENIVQKLTGDKEMFVV